MLVEEGHSESTERKSQFKKGYTKKWDFLGLTSIVLLQYEQREAADFLVEVDPCSEHGNFYSFMDTVGRVPEFTANFEDSVEDWRAVNFQCHLYDCKPAFKVRW